MTTQTDKHTPGPWHVDDAGRDTYVTSDHEHICRLEGNTLSADKANARLIAAAPELLDALQKIPQRYLDDMDAHTPGITNLIRAAIAKATGAAA